jgi:hypothetical protein
MTNIDIHADATPHADFRVMNLMRIGLKLTRFWLLCVVRA